MDVKTIVYGIQARAPWRYAASLMFKKAGLHVGQGWKDTIPDLLAQGAVSAAAQVVLGNALVEHLVAGEKSVRVFEAPAAAKAALITKAKKTKRVVNDLTNAFPGVVPESVLKALGNVSPKFYAVIDYPLGHAILFTGSRSYEERVTLGANALKATTANLYEFESVIGVITRRRQVYDAIWLPKGNDLIVVAADSPDSAVNDFAAESHIILERVIRRATGDLAVPLNLWPAVAGLYDTLDGDVIELGFITDDDSVKHLKARQGTKCLRKDTYHAAGANKVGANLQPFRIAVRWKAAYTDTLSSLPEIFLPGTARHIYGKVSELPTAQFRNCLSLSDLNLLISKLTPHL